MNKIFTIDEFNKHKRDPLISYDVYFEAATDLLMRIPRAEKKLTNPAWISDNSLATKMRLTDGRARYSINLISLNYSAGLNLHEIKELYSSSLKYFEEYAEYSNHYNSSTESNNIKGAHIALLDKEFEIANRLVCFGILLGWGSLLHRLKPIIDYNNPKKDGLLERFFGFFLPDCGVPPDECVRHLPYFKTLKIFAASKEERPELMAGYLADWYHASRREPYYNSHTQGDGFMGYWSWEAATITYLLDIDDRSFRDAQFYPKDLVDFARSMRTNPTASGTPAPTDGELRATAGQPCPKTGRWEALDIPPQVKAYQQGELMLNLGSAYGLTVWRYLNG